MQDQSTYNIKNLLLKVAKDDERAFGELFKIYYNQLGDYIMRITESEQLAEEIVQDVFLKIWVNRRLLTDIHCFKAYLLVVAKNHTFTCLKKIAADKKRNKEWVNSVLIQATNDEEEGISDNIGNLIDEAVELLPPQQKKVYIFSRRDGLKQDEIAIKLNISLETVKKHMVLALRFLKNNLRTKIGMLLLFILVMLKN